MQSIQPIVISKIFSTSSLILTRTLDYVLSKYLSTNEIILVTFALFVLLHTAIELLSKYTNPITDDDAKKPPDNEFIRIFKFIHKVTILFISLQLRKLMSPPSNKLAFIGNFALAIFTAVIVHVFKDETGSVMASIIYLYSDIFDFLIPLCGPLAAIFFGAICMMVCKQLKPKSDADKKQSFIFSYLISLCEIAANNIIFVSFDQMAVDSTAMEIMQCLFIIAVLNNVTDVNYFIYVAAIKIFGITQDLAWVAFVIIVAISNKSHWLFQLSCNYFLLFVASYIQRIDIVITPCVMLVFFYFEQILHRTVLVAKYRAQMFHK